MAIKYCEKFCKKTFSGDTYKDAYMKATKWFASNVISEDEFLNVHAQYKKLGTKESPSIEMTIYAALDNEEEVFKRHCNICKEMHHSFFINEDTQCSRCRAMGYQNRLEEQMKIKVNHYKSILNKRLGEEDE